MRPVIAVFGGARFAEDSREYAEARDVGQIIGRAGWDLLCGGYGGTMEAASLGCKEAGGECIGIGLTAFGPNPNPHIDSFTRAGSLGKRLDTFDAHADAFLALSGGIGTLTEVSFFWNLAKGGIGRNNRPLFLLGTPWMNLVSLLQREFAISEEAFRHVSCLPNKDELPALLAQYTPHP